MDQFIVGLDFLFNYQIVVAALLGALVGLERELSGKDPSLRTFALISVGSCVFSMMSIESAIGREFADPGRVAAQVVTGIGFLGAGAIIQRKVGVSGLTTAALMWVTAGIGMAVGFGREDLAVSATVVSLVVLWSLKMVHRIIRYFRPGVYDSQTDYD